MRNITVWIKPSDITSSIESDISKVSCDDGVSMSLHCRVEQGFNWCSLLDQKLNTSDYGDKGGAGRKCFHINTDLIQHFLFYS